jgi:hypothetical protein
MLIFSSRKSNRLTYILRTLLTEGLGITFKVTDSAEEFSSSTEPRINYSNEPFEGCINIKSHTILFDHGIRDYHPEVHTHERFVRIFLKNNGKDVPFDILGASFWLLSRYEEYLPHKADQHNRFVYKSSLAYQYHFLEIPLVNIWLNELRDLITTFYPGFYTKQRKFEYIPTIDIDNAYKYRHKGFVRTVAGFVADRRRFVAMKKRLSIMLGKEEDPFDCYQFLIDTHKRFEVKPVFFLLLGDYGPNDKNHSASGLQFQSLIKHIADYARVGIHPSYGSNNNLRQLKVEFARLGNITHRLITKSRQHFSMLRFPHTYHDLIQAGITADYSMGYHDHNGFRASYCYPFKWFDLDSESVSPLTIHPYTITDNTLITESKRNNVGLMELTRPYLLAVKACHGEFITLFHNENFNEELRTFYLHLLEEITRELNAPASEDSE